ncbi:MAG: PhoH family protein [Verrucomicrobiales bacterium]|nr:PhoH family protein [Verrucomicrobiales bacterium]
MNSETLHFDNPRVALQVLGNDPGNLETLQQELGVHAVARDAWIKLEGEADAVARARDLFRLLERTVVGGGSIRQHDFAVALGIVKHEGAEALEGLQTERLQPSPKKATVLPKTVGQRRYLEAIRTHAVTFGIGPAGTGKTYLGMAAAVAALKAGEVNRLILTRPAVEAGEALGFLPGDLQEKLAPYLRPLYDALHDMLPAEEIQRNMERGVIEIAPLAYMRGRTLNNAFIIFDEAQNSTEEQMFMFLTRLGFNSKAVITGDLTQIDLPRQKSSGLFEARDALARTDGVAVVMLGKRDVIRHPLVQRILTAYEEHRGVSQ